MDVGWRIEKVSGRDAVSDAMLRGWWQLTEELVLTGKDHGVDLSSTVHQTTALIRKQLQSLGESLQRPKLSVGCVGQEGRVECLVVVHAQAGSVSSPRGGGGSLLLR